MPLIIKKVGEGGGREGREGPWRARKESSGAAGVYVVVPVAFSFSRKSAEDLNWRRVFPPARAAPVLCAGTCRSGSAHLVLCLPSLALRLDSAVQRLLEVPPELVGLRPQPGGHRPAGMKFDQARVFFFLLPGAL